MAPVPVRYEFRSFCLEPSEYRLLHDNRVVSLPPKAFEVLLVLVRNHGHVIEKERLLAAVWPDVTVEEGNLAQNVWLLRKTLAMDGGDLYIETVPKRGYRFVAPVREVPIAAPQPTAFDVVAGLSSERDFLAPGTSRALRMLALVVFATTGAAALLWVPTSDTAAGTRAPRVASAGVSDVRESGAGANPEKRDTGRSVTGNAELQEMYLRGRHLFNKRTKESVVKSREYFESAVEKNPRFALAYAGLADTHLLMAGWLEPARDAYDKARAAASRALDLDDSLAEAHTALGAAQLYGDWDWANAEQSFMRATRLDDKQAMTHYHLALLLAWQGELSRAIRAMEKAREIDPLSELFNGRLALLLIIAGHYDRALALCRSMLELQPEVMSAHHLMSLAYERMGEYSEAIRLLDHFPKHAPRSEKLESLGYLLAMSGRRRDARNVLAELNRLARTEAIVRFNLAVVHAAIGEHDRAFDELKESVRDRESHILTIKVNPRLRSLHSDSRFTELLREVGLRP